MITGKELYELSERFQEKCGDNIDGSDCDGCEFKNGKEFDCPEFFLKSLDQANKIVKVLDLEDSEFILEEGIIGETINKFSSPNFSSCTFDNCEIYSYSCDN